MMNSAESGCRSLIVVSWVLAAAIPWASMAQPHAAPAGVMSSYYVWAAVREEGDGSKERPFKTLAQAEAASSAGDVIFVSTTGSLEPLDGGIALKPGQRLIGLGPWGAPAKPVSSMARLTNTTEHLGGVVVKLSERNEVSGLHLIDLEGHGIHGSGTNYSGTWIHHNEISGAVASEELIVGILLEADSGVLTDVRVTDNVIRDGEDLAGIRVMHTGDARGEYQFARNHLSDIGGRAYLVWSRGQSYIRSTILDSTANNIGRGERNADSIDPRLWGSSEQHMVVRRYHYNNTGQTGSRSNTGLEAFLMGEPFRDEAEWCNGCKLTLEILDSVFENTITDGIQLTNYGSNSVLDLAIRNTKIIGANPQQAGGAISLIAQNQYNTGSRTKLLVENCDLINSGRFGFAITDRSGEYSSTVDLGGGDLGSVGHNRIVGSAEAEIRVLNANPVAKHNWWGGGEPRVDMEGEKSTVDLEPALETDPRRP